MLGSDRRHKAGEKPWDLHSRISVFTSNSSKNTVHALWAEALRKWLISFYWDHLCNPLTAMEGKALIWGLWVWHSICNKNKIHDIYVGILWSESSGIYQVIVLTMEAQWAIWKPSSIAHAVLDRRHWNQASPTCPDSTGQEWPRYRSFLLCYSDSERKYLEKL